MEVDFLAGPSYWEVADQLAFCSCSALVYDKETASPEVKQQVPEELHATTVGVSELAPSYHKTAMAV